MFSGILKPVNSLYIKLALISLVTGLISILLISTLICNFSLSESDKFSGKALITIFPYFVV